MRLLRRRLTRRRGGQASIETVMMAPVFFVAAFSALQLCHIGLGIVVVQYATASAARQIVQQNTSTPTVNDGRDRFDHLMTAGLRDTQLVPGPNAQDDSPLIKTMTIIGCARIGAFPLVGQMIKAASSENINETCQADAPLVSLAGGSSGSFDFVIRAHNTFRLNYQK